MYCIIAFFKGLRRRWLIDKATVIYKTYGDSSRVGDWHGWYEMKGECLAFRDIHDTLHFEW